MVRLNDVSFRYFYELLKTHIAESEDVTTRSGRATLLGIDYADLTLIETYERLPTEDEAAILDTYCESATFIVRNEHGVVSVSDLE